MPRRNPALPAALARLDRESAARAHVATTAQARAAGVSADAIRALVAAGRWMHLHRGVHLTRPGVPSLLSRMWGAHLALGPTSVVGGTTAAAYWGLLDGLIGPVEMLLPDGCSRTARGVRVRRVPHPSSLAHPVRQPPVLSVDGTVLEMVRAAPTDGDAVEVVLRSIRNRLTTAERLRGAADQRPRLRRRALLAEVCADAEAGQMSPLERRYARAVEHRHGLPRGDRQRRVVSTGGRTAYRDVEYVPFGVIVELDGRRGHEGEAGVLRDQQRDNAAVLTGCATLRFGWQSVAAQSCEVARQVIGLLRLRGWTGVGRACGPGCPVAVPG